MASTKDFRNGLCIVFNNDLYTIVTFQHVKPGKGGAFVRTKLKNIKTGKVIENTFNAGVKITTARVERIPYQFLYKDGEGLHFMHKENFEALILPEAAISTPLLLKEGNDVSLLYYAEKEEIIGCELPAFISLEVTYTEPGQKGDTATKALKPATLETGFSLQVPLFINIGDILKIDTRTSLYVEREKRAVVL